METFLNTVWVTLLAPLIVAIAVTTYSEWLTRKKNKQGKKDGGHRPFLMPFWDLYKHCSTTYW